MARKKRTSVPRKDRTDADTNCGTRSNRNSPSRSRAQIQGFLSVGDHQMDGLQDHIRSSRNPNFSSFEDQDDVHVYGHAGGNEHGYNTLTSQELGYGASLPQSHSYASDASNRPHAVPPLTDTYASSQEYSHDIGLSESLPYESDYEYNESEEEHDHNHNRNLDNGTGSRHSNGNDEEDHEPLEAFFNRRGYDQHATDDEQTQARPESACSIASSVFKKASSVFQETSTVVKGVIKHGTFCGASRQDSEGRQSGPAVSNSSPSPHASSTGGHISVHGHESSFATSSVTGFFHSPPGVHTIPLRHIQSSPTHQQMGILGQPSLVKRSVSTPPTFLQSRRGSAFGRVQSNSSLHENQIGNRIGSGSAFGPLRGIGRGGGSSNDGHGITVELKKQFSSLSIKSGASSTASAATSTGTATSSMCAKAQRTIKARRRLRNQQNKEKGSSSSASKDLTMHESAKLQKDDTSIPKSMNKKEKAKEIASKPQAPKISAKGEVPEVRKVTSLDSTTFSDTTTNVTHVNNASYVPLDAEPERISVSIQNKEPSPSSAEEDDFLAEVRGQEIPSPIPLPEYQKIEDDGPLPRSPTPGYASNFNSNPPLPSQPRRSKALKSQSVGARAVTLSPPQPHFVLPIRPNSANGAPNGVPSVGSRSPSSQTTRSGHSASTLNQTFNTSMSGTVSCSRSITSSVAEADREVRETNRRELRRFEMGGCDLDGSMSIQSSDTTSTNPHAYLALNSSATQLREGASMQFDRFFARNGGSRAIIGAHSGSNGRPPAMNARSPITVSSNNSVTHSNCTASTGEEPPPPRFIQTKFGGGNKIAPAPMVNDDVGYCKLGSGSEGAIGNVIGNGNNSVGGNGVSISSSKSSSSKSSSKSSRRKDRRRSYQRMRTSTSSPSLCNSFTASPVKTPISPPNRFNFPREEPSDLPKPHVRRHVFVSPNTTMSGNMHHHPNDNMQPNISMQDGHGMKQSHSPMSYFRAASFRRVTPEKASIDEFISN